MQLEFPSRNAGSMHAPKQLCLRGGNWIQDEYFRIHPRRQLTKIRIKQKIDD